MGNMCMWKRYWKRIPENNMGLWVAIFFFILYFQIVNTISISYLGNQLKISIISLIRELNELEYGTK